MIAAMPFESPHPAPDRGTILVVDDDDFLRAVVSGTLREAGFFVEEANTVEVALRTLGSGNVEAVICDILMPGLTGLDMLRMIRGRDLDVPVVLLTGSPSLETAIQAIEGGALRYLTKSADMASIVATMKQAVQIGRLARWRRQALVITQPDFPLAGDPAGMTMVFEEALSGLWLAAQPIVRATDGGIFGFELLSRTTSSRFTNITSIFKVAEKLGRVISLGRRVRELASTLDIAKDRAIFINLHCLDLDDEQLYTENNPLCRVESQVILEVTERHSIDQVKDLVSKVARLRALGFKIAVDDMGSGYSGLNSFATLRPDLMKVDLGIVRGIDADPYRRTLVRSLVAMSRELDIPLVAEGVETPAEKAALMDLGCDFLQGFLCGMPQPVRPRTALLGSGIDHEN
jgi:EAL domain-containing protein (putative c-di-GMP-specific phosphodiesterase class I)